VLKANVVHARDLADVKSANTWDVTIRSHDPVLLSASTALHIRCSDFASARTDLAHLTCRNCYFRLFCERP
jgi:hypothetical protein